MMESPAAEHKRRQAVVCEQIREEVTRYSRAVHTGSLVRIPIHPILGIHGHRWERLNAASSPCVLWWKDKITPLATYCRLLPSVAVALAKKRAREVILTLLLVCRRLELQAPPREIRLRLLGEVNKEECSL